MASVCFSSTQEALDNVCGVRFRFNDAKGPDEVSKANSRMKALSSVTAAALAFAALGGSFFKPKLSDDTSNEEQHASNVDVCFDDDETAAKRARVTTSGEDEYLRLREMQQKKLTLIVDIGKAILDANKGLMTLQRMPDSASLRKADGATKQTVLQALQDMHNALPSNCNGIQIRACGFSFFKS